MKIEIEFEQETDGRWIAEAPAYPGALAYGATISEAGRLVQALVLRIIADRLENGELQGQLYPITFAGRNIEPVAVN